MLIGILPLYSHKNAGVPAQRSPGMTIPGGHPRAHAPGRLREGAQAEGVRIAQEACSPLRDLVQGAYVMPPFNKVDLAVRVLEVLR